jgi:putative tryptophan/tyrosine transport system substrate-binding protein
MLVTVGDALFTGHNAELAALALRYAMPTIIQYRDFPAAGGLVSYGGNIAGAHRQVGNYAGRILNGTKPTCRCNRRQMSS